MSAFPDLLAQFAAPAPAPVRVGWRTNVAPAWEFDVAAIERAARRLGIERPIEVGCVEWSRKRAQYGMYHPPADGEPHSVRVRRALDATGASEALWHELTHAKQHELGHVFRKHRGYRAYLADPLEVQARAHEALARRNPLVLPR